MLKKGFTLVELIIALTIFALLSGGIYYALGTELDFWQRVVSQAEKQQINNAVMHRLVRDIRAAEEIMPSSDNFDLRLKHGAEIIEYTLVNQKVRRKKNLSASYLTDINEVTELFFAYPAPGLVEVYLNDLVTRAALRN